MGKSFDESDRWWKRWARRRPADGVQMRSKLQLSSVQLAAVDCMQARWEVSRCSIPRSGSRPAKLCAYPDPLVSANTGPCPRNQLGKAPPGPERGGEGLTRTVAKEVADGTRPQRGDCVAGGWRGAGRVRTTDPGNRGLGRERAKGTNEPADGANREAIFRTGRRKKSEEETMAKTEAAC